ncbi:MAG: hypothetical protein IJM81_06680 [Prevotella sp.]|nr:hypothetical protein [Prevotella sp.]
MRRNILWIMLPAVMLVCGQQATAQSSPARGELSKGLRGGSLPATAVLADEDDALVVYLNTDREGNEAEFELAQVSVWVLDKQTGRSRRLFQCNPKAEYDISQTRRIKGEEIPYVDFVKIWPYAEPRKIIVVGTLPDYHNVSTSIVDVATGRATMLACNDGFVGFDPEDGNLLVASYAYYWDDEGGRYAVIKAFDEQGKLLGSMELRTRP